ncbi:MAG: PspC domain-containing protein [Candidatus Saccharimonas sp.]
MKEITRIHIAKTAYEIEVTAKKHLEKYLKSLEEYTDDKDVIIDIEIRMTELLRERGVTPGGVIASDDIASLREQLGEPYEFAGEDGDMAVGAFDEDDRRRLFRDSDRAVLGGVLAGIAAYFKVNPLWLRLGFLVVTIMSFGMAAFAYAIFWLVIPSTRTAAEKLQLLGKPVTAKSIKELNSYEEVQGSAGRIPILQQVLMVAIGVGCLVTAFIVFGLTLWSGIVAISSDSVSRFASGSLGFGNDQTWLIWLGVGLVGFGMLLLVALLSLIAYGLLSRRLTRRMVVSGIIIIALGVTSVAIVAGGAATQSWRNRDEIHRLYKTSKVALPKTFSTIRTLKVTGLPSDSTESYAYAVNVRYIADGSTPRYEWSALPGTKPKVVVEGEMAVLTMVSSDNYRDLATQPQLVVHGPKLDALIVASNASVAYSVGKQDSLAAESIGSGASISVDGSILSAIVSGKNSYIDLSQSSVKQLSVDASTGLSVLAGTVYSLSVVQPDVCPASGANQETSVRVEAVSSGEMSYNGVKQSAKTHVGNCATIVIGDDENSNYQEGV